MLSITVNYIWTEYIDILKEFAPVNAYKEKHNQLPSGTVALNLWGKLSVYILGSLMFALKVRKVGLCTFNVDPQGFSRQSSVGKKFVAWEQVKHIHSLSGAYLMELEQGFIPLPFRCFNDNQRSQFEGYVSNKMSCN